MRSDERSREFVRGNSMSEPRFKAVMGTKLCQRTNILGSGKRLDLTLVVLDCCWLCVNGFEGAIGLVEFVS